MSDTDAKIYYYKKKQNKTVNSCLTETKRNSFKKPKKISKTSNRN